MSEPPRASARPFVPIELHAERDAAIAALKRQGVAASQLAVRFGISRQRVHQILQRQAKP